MSKYLPVNSSDPDWRRRAESDVRRLRRRRPVRYSRDSDDDSEFVTLAELRAELGDEIAARLAHLFDHATPDGESYADRDRVADALEMLLKGVANG
jgi:hypothetical protein